MNTNIVFSVIIPAYNRELSIQRSIKSVLSQTYHNFEIIVVDDGSVDNTVKNVLSFKDERVKLVRQQNSGANVARNNGILHAKGKYISFLDSDDEWMPTLLEKQLKKYESDPQIGVVYSTLYIQNEKGIKSPFGKKFGIEGYCYKEVLMQGYLSSMIVLSAKKEALENVGLLDTSLPASQDDDICFRLAKECKVAYIDEFLACAYVDQGGRISSSNRRVAMGWWKLWNKHENDVVLFCGNETMSAHYCNCIKRFLFCNMHDEAYEAYKKYQMYGGKRSLCYYKTLNYILMFKLKISKILSFVR